MVIGVSNLQLPLVTSKIMITHISAVWISFHIGFISHSSKLGNTLHSCMSLYMSISSLLLLHCIARLCHLSSYTRIFSVLPAIISLLCPVAALQSYLSLKGLEPCQLYLNKNPLLLIGNMVRSILHYLSAALHLPPWVSSLHALHSVQDEIISRICRWLSGAYQKCISWLVIPQSPQHQGFDFSE